MGTYRDALAQAEKLLLERKYGLCSMDCGKKVESILKELLKRYLENASEAKCRALKSQIPQKYTLNTLTLGQLAKLYESEHILQNLILINDTKHNELRSIDLAKIAHIRNQAAHNNKDTELEKSDAYILYGSLLKLLKITGLLDVLEEHGEIQASSINERKIAHPIQLPPTEKADEASHRVNKPFTGTSILRKSPSGRHGMADFVVPTGKAREIKEGIGAGHDNKGRSKPLVENDLITVVQNKTSRKYFIYLETDGNHKDEVINPIGNIVPFVPNLYEEPEEVKVKDFLSTNFINNEQMKRYNKHKQGERYLEKYLDNHRQQGSRGQSNIIDTTQTRSKYGLKRVFPRGCTVDGNHYQSGSDAIDTLISMGKIRKGDVPTSSYNAHRWLKENYYEFGFRYKRDET